MNKTTLKLLLIYFFLFLPIFAVNYFGLKKYSQAKVESKQLLSYKNKFHALSVLENINNQTIERHKDSIPNYIYTSLETLNLNSSKNGKSLQFLETSICSHPKIKEYSETLTQKVEIDLKEIKSILFRIEPSSFFQISGKPHMIITDFTLKKNKGLENNLYRLNLEFIKREYS